MGKYVWLLWMHNTDEYQPQDILQAIFNDLDKAQQWRPDADGKVRLKWREVTDVEGDNGVHFRTYEATDPRDDYYYFELYQWQIHDAHDTPTTDR